MVERPVISVRGNLHTRMKSTSQHTVLDSIKIKNVQLHTKQKTIQPHESITISKP